MRLPVSDLNQPEYYARREEQERQLAAIAISPAIGEIHLELADRYAELVRLAQPAPAARPRLKLVYS